MPKAQARVSLIGALQRLVWVSWFGSHLVLQLIALRSRLGRRYRVTKWFDLR